jgi:hypothetical protein
VALDDGFLATVIMVALLGGTGGEGGTTAIPQRLLTSLLGTGRLREIMARAQAELLERARLILDEEMLRFAAVIESAGTPDAADALLLYQATYALEVAR